MSNNEDLASSNIPFRKLVKRLWLKKMRQFLRNWLMPSKKITIRYPIIIDLRGRVRHRYEGGVLSYWHPDIIVSKVNVSGISMDDRALNDYHNIPRRSTNDVRIEYDTDIDTIAIIRHE
jgi:hypothetical protein